MNTSISNRNSRLSIIVLGYIIRGPVGGMAWHHLQYLLGFAQLGHDVYFFEDSDNYPSCYDPRRLVVDTDPSYGIRFVSSAFERLGLKDRWAYYDGHTSRWLGPLSEQVHNIFKDCDLVVNISGVNPLREWLLHIPKHISTHARFFPIS